MSIFHTIFARLRAPVRRVYLDYAAATPVRLEVLRAMAPYFYIAFGNPGAIHAEGQRVARAVAHARDRVAHELRVRTEEVMFTSGGTESNNIAIFGIVEALAKAGRPYDSMEVLTLPTEHPSVLESVAALGRRGVSVRMLSIHEDGLIDMAAFETALTKRTVLVVLSYANSETGVVQDVKRLTRAVRAHRSANEHALPYVLLDASQAPLYLSCALDSLGVELMTLDAGKCYGPKGVGVLVHRAAVPLAPTLYGGGQEGGLRPGTENVPLIVGCAEALVLAQRGHAAASGRIAALRDYFFERLLNTFPDVLVNGSRTARIANNVNISIPGLDGEYAVVALDRRGIAASTRSACAGTSGSGSHVVQSMTGDAERAASTIRFTLGRTTTRREIDRAVDALVEHSRIAIRAPKRRDQTQN